MMGFVTRDTEFSPYLLLPRFLFHMGINETAILVYVLLLDRIRLSMGNDKWIDEFGRVFAIYPIRQLAIDARHGERIVKDALSVLEKADLIYRFHQGVGRPNLIYLKVPDISAECSIPPTGCAENCPPEVQKIALLEGGFGTTNKNNRERTTEQKPGSKEAPHGYGTYSNVFLTAAQHERLRQTCPGIDKLIDRMSCYLESSGKNYTNYEAALRSWAQREPETYQTMDYSYEEGESL